MRRANCAHETSREPSSPLACPPRSHSSLGEALGSALLPSPKALDRLSLISHTHSTRAHAPRCAASLTTPPTSMRARRRRRRRRRVGGGEDSQTERAKLCARSPGGRRKQSTDGQSAKFNLEERLLAAIIFAPEMPRAHFDRENAITTFDFSSAKVKSVFWNDPAGRSNGWRGAGQL